VSNQATRLAEEARALSKRLREPKVTHHQISHDHEPYRTAVNVHPVESIKLEAANTIDAFLALVQPAVSEEAGFTDEPYAWFWTDGSESGVLTLRQDFETHRAQYPNMRFTPVWAVPRIKRARAQSSSNEKT